MTAVPLVEMPDQARTEYALWLWELVQTGEPDQLLEYERRLGCSLRGIRARRHLAKRAEDPAELRQFLSILALWPDQEETKPRRMGSGLKLTYNQGYRHG